MMSTIVYAALEAYGTRLFRDYVERCFALGAALAAKLEAAPDFELVVPPESNIVCWRWRPPGAGGAALDALQAAVRRRVLERGRYYVLQTRLGGHTVMRAALMNPLIEEVDLDGLLDEIRACGTSEIRS
jgi:L-2,4-diaminobutyrate decarboxylase